MTRDEVKDVLLRAVEAGHFGEVDGTWPSALANQAIDAYTPREVRDAVVWAATTDARVLLERAAELVGRPLEWDEAEFLVCRRVYQAKGPLSKISNGWRALRVAFGLPWSFE